jgi:hypothetical protein
MQARILVAVLFASAAIAFGATVAPASALNPLKPICSAAGLFSGLVGRACSAVEHGGRLLDAGKKLVTGNVSDAGKTLLGGGGSKVASAATTALALSALVAWVVGGASFVLHETSKVIGRTTEPQLSSTWFSATYWRLAGIAAVLTLPFLFAAAVQALVQSDITLLIRSALGYLPLALLAVAIAAPVTMLLLSASDQLAAIVSSAASNQSAHFLNRESGLIGALTHAAASPFVGFFVALLTVAAALGLWIELMMRAAAVYVIVLLLPLAFAAFVWPARRVWVVRAIELLLALIVSKFIVVAVLALGGAALSQSTPDSFVGMIAGVVLLVLAAFAPWALLRLLPVTEIAGAAAASLRHEGRSVLGVAGRADAWAGEADAWATKAAQMRRDAQEGSGGGADAERARLAEGHRDGGKLLPSASVAAGTDLDSPGASGNSTLTASGTGPTGSTAVPTSGVAAADEADRSTPSGPPPGAAAPATDERIEFPQFLQAGGGEGLVLGGPDSLRPLAPELEADPPEGDGSPLDQLDRAPPPQDPPGGRL